MALQVRERGDEIGLPDREDRSEGRTVRVVNQAFRENICDNAQVTIIAAVLACKQAGRTPVMMVQSLSAAYQEVLNRYRLINELYQVEVAARLLQ